MYSYTKLALSRLYNYSLSETFSRIKFPHRCKHKLGEDSNIDPEPEIHSSLDRWCAAPEQQIA